MDALLELVAVVSRLRGRSSVGEGEEASAWTVSAPRRCPPRGFAINAAWLHLALTGIDLLAWTQLLLLDGELATAEPKKLRYRLLHVAARLTRSARQTRLRIAQHWPWATDLATAFNRLATLPRPVT